LIDMMRMWLGVLLICGTAVSLAGCGQKTPGPATRVAEQFVQAVQSKNGRLACSLLTETARSSVTGATDATCPDAIVGVQDSGSDVHEAQVWGDTAQVRIGSDVLFLRQLDTGWKVSAAGCTPQPEGPYDCDVQG
jgi:predicted small lipoprotein YifL